MTYLPLGFVFSFIILLDAPVQKRTFSISYVGLQVITVIMFNHNYEVLLYFYMPECLLVCVNTNSKKLTWKVL